MWIQKVPGGGVHSLVYAPDGRSLYSLDSSGWVTAWDLATRSGTRLFTTFPERPGYADRLAVGGGGRHLLVFGHTTPNRNVPRPGVWFVWDVQAATELGRVQMLLECGARAEADGPTIVRVGPGTVRRWDYVAADYTADLGTWSVPDPVRFAELSVDCRTAAIVTVRGDVYVADLTAGAPAYRLNLSDPVYSGLGVAFSPDGKTLAVLYHQLMYLWDVPGRRVRAKALWSVPGPDWKLSFHPAAPVFATLNRDKILTLFSLDTGDPVKSLDFALGRKVQCVAFAPDGLTCAVGGSNKQFAVFDVDL